MIIEWKRNIIATTDIINQSKQFNINKLEFSVNSSLRDWHKTKSKTYNGNDRTINIELKSVLFNNGILDLIDEVLVNS